jgi:hypothetical protein
LRQALTPTLALDYVRELSADVRAALVLDGEGGMLAGPPQLAAAARALLEAGGDAAELEVVRAEGVVCAVRTPDRAAVAVCGRFAIAGVVRRDLRAAVAALESRSPGSGVAAATLEAPPDEASSEALERAAEALISALQRGFQA